MRDYIGIQYLRGLAASMVVLYHLGVPLERLGYQGGWPIGLSSGVDIFFVISGFVMWMSTRTKSVTPLQFWRRRIVRIVPLYWLVTSLMLAILLLMPSVMQTSVFDGWHVVASYLFIPYPSPAHSAMEPLLFAGWTLNYEMFFYLVFGLFLPVGAGRRLLAITGVFGALVVVGFIARPPVLSVPGFYTRDIILEFVFGVLLAEFVFRKQDWPPMAFPAFLLLALAGLAAMIGFGELPVIPWGLRYGIPALAVVAGVVGMELTQGIPRVALLREVGDASYSIYLTQLISMAAFLAAWKKLYFAPGTEHFLAFAALDALFAILCGIVCYRLVEQPLIALLRWRPAHRPVVAT